MKIDSEFQALIPPLSSEEYSTLEASCIEEGIRHPLVAWGDILIDGHTRYEIAKRHHLLYKVERIEFASREDAIVWIITNQCGRRNLSELDRVMLIEKKRSIVEEKARARQAKGGAIGAAMTNGRLPPNLEEAGTRGEVTHQLAREAGVSHNTYEALATVSKSGTEELKQATRQKVIGASTAAKIAVLPAQEQREIVALNDKNKIVEEAKKRTMRQPGLKTRIEQAIAESRDINRVVPAVKESESAILEEVKRCVLRVIDINFPKNRKNGISAIIEWLVSIKNQEE